MMWIGTDNGVVRWDGRALVTTRRTGGVAIGARADDVQGPRSQHLDRRVPERPDPRQRPRRRDDAGARRPRRRHRRRPCSRIATAISGSEARAVSSACATASSRPTPRPQGLPAATQGPVYADDDERIWFAPSTGGLYWFRRRPGRPRHGRRCLATDVVYSIAGRGNEVWIGRQRGGLTRCARPVPPPSPPIPSPRPTAWRRTASTPSQSRPTAAVWAGTLSGGVSHLGDGRFTTYTVADGLASNTVATIVDGRRRHDVVRYAERRQRLSAGRWRSFTTRDGLPSNEVNALFEDTTAGFGSGRQQGSR